MTRKVDSSGGVSIAGHNYKVGKRHARHQVQIAIVGDRVEISADGEVLKVHPIRHDRSRENGTQMEAGERADPKGVQEPVRRLYRPLVDATVKLAPSDAITTR